MSEFAKKIMNQKPAIVEKYAKQKQAVTTKSKQAVATKPRPVKRRAKDLDPTQLFANGVSTLEND